MGRTARIARGSNEGEHLAGLRSAPRKDIVPGGAGKHVAVMREVWPTAPTDEAVRVLVCVDSNDRLCVLGKPELTSSPLMTELFGTMWLRHFLNR